MENIYIVGAGAIGKALAVFLTLQGKKVKLLRGSVDDHSTHVEIIKAELSDATVLEAAVEISTFSRYAALDGIVVLASKSYGNAGLAAVLRNRISQRPLVILQNGLNIEQPFTVAGFPQLYRGVLFASSQPVSPGTIRFKPVAISPVGIVRGTAEGLAGIVEQISSPPFQFRAEENIEPLTWAKTIVNSVFNSVCPLLETDNGIFHRNSDALGIAKRVIAECLSVARANGIILQQEAVVHTLLLISKSSDGQFISTYQDIQHKRPTEIASFNAAIVTMAEQLGKAAAVRETRLLGELVKIKAGINLPKP